MPIRSFLHKAAIKSTTIFVGSGIHITFTVHSLANNALIIRTILASVTIKHIDKNQAITFHQQPLNASLPGYIQPIHNCPKFRIKRWTHTHSDYNMKSTYLGGLETNLQARPVIKCMNHPCSVCSCPWTVETNKYENYPVDFVEVIEVFNKKENKFIQEFYLGINWSSKTYARKIIWMNGWGKQFFVEPKGWGIWDNWFKIKAANGVAHSCCPSLTWLGSSLQRRRLSLPLWRKLLEIWD